MNALETAAKGQRDAAGRGDLPPGASEGTYALGTPIMVSRDGLGAEIRNPDLPCWFPARVCMPEEDEPGNWYRWYDPYIWYETEIDLSNGGEWASAKRNKAYVGKLWYDAEWCRDWWAMPLDAFKETEPSSEPPASEEEPIVEIDEGGNVRGLDGKPLNESPTILRDPEGDY